MTDVLGTRAAAHDELLLRAVEAVNRGDLRGAHALAQEVLAADAGNLDASTLLATESQPTGEVRRITVMFCDLVGSTSLSGRLDPELYRGLLARYRKLATELVESVHGGSVASIKGDGMLALFGYPSVHGNDTERAVRCGLEIAAGVQELSDQIAQSIGEPLAVRAAVHRGLLYIDPEQNDVYGLAANVAARLQDLAKPGTVVISEDVRRLVNLRFETEAGTPQLVKGVDEPLQPFRVIGPRAAGSAIAVRTPIVGRGPELAQLRALWERACTSDAATVVGASIVGEAGIGKTRLAAAIIADALDEGATVVALAGSPDHREVGFHPVRTLLELRSHVGSTSSSAQQVRQLAEHLETLGFAGDDTVPLLAPILGLDPEAGYTAATSDANKLTGEIAKAAAEYVLACLGDGPAVFAVEDLHDFDEASADLVDRVLRSGRPQTLAIITSRAAPARQTEQIDLTPLSRDACLALIDALAPAGAPVRVARGELVERSDGIPLFIEELVRSSDLEPVDVRHRPARSSASTVPDVLYEPLMARLHGAPNAAEVASAAATIGRDVDVDLLGAAVGLTQVELELALDSLLGGLILERVVYERPTVRFRHELVREVAYDLLPPSRRREVHARVAGMLVDAAENEGRCDWALVAGHFERADRLAEAIRAWQEAAQAARRRGSVGEARLHLGRAIDLVEQLPHGPERSQREVELRLQRGYLASSAEGMSSPSATLDYERCLELTLEVPHAPNMVSTLTAMWGYYTSRAEIRTARQISATLQALVAEPWGSFWRPQNIASFAMLDWFEGDFVRAEEQLQLSIDRLYAEETFDTEATKAWYLPSHPTVAMHVHLAIAKFMVGDTVGAEVHREAATQLADSLEFPQGPWSGAYARWLVAWMDMEQGAHDRSFATLAELTSIGERHGYDSWSLVALTQHAATTGARDLGRSGAVLTPGIAMLSALVGAWQMVDLRSCLTIYHTVLGHMTHGSGDLSAARDRYEESLELARNTGMRFYDAETLRLRAHLADSDANVIQELHEALDLARSQGASPFELRIALDLHDLQGTAALDVLRTAVDGFRADASYVELDEARRRINAA
ncbi:MAG: AAA family ATPase [Actinomycetota bacterium]|nr:AAA family ATPase [Actinomycetota bacterium]